MMYNRSNMLMHRDYLGGEGKKKLSNLNKVPTEGNPIDINVPNQKYESKPHREESECEKVIKKIVANSNRKRIYGVDKRNNLHVPIRQNSNSMARQSMLAESDQNIKNRRSNYGTIKRINLNPQAPSKFSSQKHKENIIAALQSYRGFDVKNTPSKTFERKIISERNYKAGYSAHNNAHFIHNIYGNGHNKIKSINLKNSKQNESCEQNSVKFSYDTFSIKGSKKKNQDCIKAGDGVWIICDGHGENGHEVSWYVANMLFEICQQKLEEGKFNKAVLKEMFIDVKADLQRSQIDLSLSGSTCVMIVIEKGLVYCASLGDSMAMMIYANHKYQMLSVEHKPINKLEKQRIEFFGGVVKRHPNKQRTQASPYRLWGNGLDDWGPGLAVSRAFGDKMGQKYGLISEPQISAFELEKSMKFIVMGSDGLFDRLPASQIQAILQMHDKRTQSEGMAKKLSSISKRRWEGGYSDDISTVVIFL